MIETKNELNEKGILYENLLRDRGPLFIKELCNIFDVPSSNVLNIMSHWRLILHKNISYVSVFKD